MNHPGDVGRQEQKDDYYEEGYSKLPEAITGETGLDVVIDKKTYKRSELLLTDQNNWKFIP